MRRRRHDENQSGEINLAPFMNMVVILIPMLLLSVIFVSAGVINTSTSLAHGPLSESDEQLEPDESLDLTVVVSPEGFEVLTNDSRLSARDGCREDGPTICLTDDSVDVDRQFERARELAGADKMQAANEALATAVDAYDFRRLYNELARLKQDHPDETRIKLSGAPEVPYELLVRIMDVARSRLDRDHYEDDASFRAAAHRLDVRDAEPLFSDPILARVD